MLNRLMIMSRRSVFWLLLLLAFSGALCAGSNTIGVSAGSAAPSRMVFGPAAPRGQSTLGDLVWLDINLNGRWGAGEPGIDGVVVQLYSDDGDGEFDPNGADVLLQQMTTGDNPATLAVEHGWYDFNVEGNSKLYWVLLTASNFEPGGPLAGLVFTSAETKGPTPMLVFIYGVVEDYNEADFGYARTSLRLVKTAGNAPDGQPLTLPAPGPVTYTYRVTNTGDTYLINVVITDDNGTLGLPSDDFLVCALAEMLAPGATSSCSHTTTILGDRINVALATGQPADAFGIEFSGDPAFDSDDATVIIGTVSMTPTPYQHAYAGQSLSAYHHRAAAHTYGHGYTYGDRHAYTNAHGYGDPNPDADYDSHGDRDGKTDDDANRHDGAADSRLHPPEGRRGRIRTRIGCMRRRASPIACTSSMARPST